MGEQKRLNLFIFIDALGWEILQKYPFLEDVLPVRAPLETIFGYSSTCDPTIITGKLPREHGHFSFFRYDPEASPFGLCRLLSALPGFVTGRGRVRRQLSRLIQWYRGYTGYFQIYNMPFRYLSLFDYTEKRDIFRPGGINSGDPNIFDALQSGGIPFYMSGWRAKEEDRFKALEAALEKGEIAFAYLLLQDLDGILHAHGTDAPVVAEKIRQYERRLRQVIARAKENYGAVRIFIFSDHGMTDVAETCDLKAQIDRLGLRFGRDYAAVYDSTMARFWFLRDAAREPIARALEAEPLGRILSDADLAGYGCDFPDRRYGEMFFSMNPGVLICPSFMGERPIAGMHGYAPEHPDSVASFLCNAAPEPFPRRLDDLYELMFLEAFGRETGSAPKVVQAE